MNSTLVYGATACSAKIGHGRDLILAIILVCLSAAQPRAVAQLSVTNGLALWLRADAGVMTNAAGGVTLWEDQSGNANHGGQFDDVFAPALVADALNGKPAVRFDGDNDYLEVSHSASLEITGNISSFFVIRFDDFATFRAVWGKTLVNLPRPTDYYVLPNTGIPRVFRGGETQLGNVDATARLRVGTYVVLGFQMEGTTLTHYLNGQAIGSGEITAELSDAGTPLRIGTRDDFVTQMKGDIAELLIYDTALTEADRNALISYLQAKYGITNLAPSITLTSPANNATFSASTNITLAANASDSDGAIARVDFFANGRLLGAATAPPYRLAVRLASAGAVAFSAVATDNKDATAAAPAVTVTVTGGATPSLTATNGLALWLRADAGITTNETGLVSDWTDQSGQNNHAVQFDPAMGPLLVDNAVNGEAALRFDGIDDFLDVPPPSAPSGERPWATSRVRPIIICFPTAASRGCSGEATPPMPLSMAPAGFH